MVDKLAETRFLAVVGSSGSGKSSLVNCGLRPGAAPGTDGPRRHGVAHGAVPSRQRSDRRHGPRAGQDGVLFRACETEGLTLAEIVEATLRMSKLGLIDIFEQAALGEGVNLLVVVDQFEELFRYRQLTRRRHLGRGRRRLREPAARGQGAAGVRIFVVLTMRSDFLGDCTQFPGLAEAINAGQYLVPRLTRDERRAAIEGPVGVGGAQIAPVLLTRLVNDVGDNPDQLSILQHALNRTWARWREKTGGKGLLDLEHYEAIGTMAHALDQHAEQAYARTRPSGSSRSARSCSRRSPTRPPIRAACGVRPRSPRLVRAHRRDAGGGRGGDRRLPQAQPLLPDAAGGRAARAGDGDRHLAREPDAGLAAAQRAGRTRRPSRRRSTAAWPTPQSCIRQDERSLWRDPELQLALDWRDEEPSERGLGVRATIRDSPRPWGS